VENDKHAQFDAISRTYDYFLHIYKDPFLNELSALYQEKELNLVNMQTAANLLKKYKNFKAFCLTPDKNSTTLCEITEANLFCNQSGDQIRFQISSNRFLKGMVRIIMRMMIDIGNHKLSLDQFENYLISKEIKTSHHLAFPQGLYLSKVDYSFLNIPARTHFLTSHNHQWTKIIP
jgi:tRNA pseudouridine38-40 synthase